MSKSDVDIHIVGTLRQARCCGRSSWESTLSQEPCGNGAGFCVCYLLWLTKKIQLLSFLNFLEVTEVSKTVAGGILGDARLGSHICQESLLAGELAVIIKFSCQRADSLHCWVLPRHSTTKWNFCHELEIILKYVLFWVPKDPCRKKMKIYTA